MLNPKAAAVYLTLAPQFLNPVQPLLGQMLWLRVAHVVVGGGWLAIWAVTVHGIHRRVGLSRFRARLNALGGAVMIGLGVRTAATQ